LDNVLFILLIAVAALFQLLSKTVSKARKSESKKTSTSPTLQKPPQVRRVQKESDADRIRKFLEALGQPPTTPPPRPAVQRTDVPPRPLAPVRPPPVIPGAWRLPREQQTKRDISQRESPPREQPKHVEFVPPIPAFEVRERALATAPGQPTVVKMPVEAQIAFGRPIAKAPDTKTDIATLLASNSSLREAIILREIFGPPRSLQPLDVVGGA
jgi:hypothetical protein